MREKNVKEIVRYYYEIPEMVRLLKTEQREQESLYDTLKGTGGDGMPGGGGPGKPVETAVIRLDERGVYERLQEIHVRLLVWRATPLPCGAVWMVFPVSTKASFNCGTNVTIAGRISRYAWERRTAPCGAGTTKLFCAWAKRWTRCPWRRSFWSVLHARVHIKRRKIEGWRELLFHLTFGEGGGPAAVGRAVSISCVFLSVKSRAQRLFPAGTNGPWENNLRMA